MLRETQVQTNNYLIKQLPGATAFVNTKFEVVHASDKWVSLFDFNPSTVFGKTLHKLFKSIDQDWQNVLDGCLLGKHSEVHLERHIDKAKNERWFKWSNIPWYDDKENVIGIILNTEDVTERIQNELQLEKLEVLFKEKSEIGKIGHWEYDAEKNELLWCNITKAIHEVPMDYVPNISNGHTFYKEGYRGETIANMVRKAVSTGEQVSGRIPLVTAKGKHIWVLAAGQPIQKNGVFIGLIGTCQDITDIVTAEAKTKESEELLRKLIDNLPLNVFIKDLESRKILVNKSECDFFGVKNPEEILGKNMFDFYSKEKAQRFRNEDLEVMNNNTPMLSIESTFTKKDGSSSTFLTSKIPLTNSEGQVTGLIGFSLDISKVKQKEQELKENEHLLRTLVDNLPLNVYIKDLESRKILVNQSECDYLGVKNPKELLGKSDFDLYDKKIAQISRNEDLKVLTSLKPIIGKETVNITKDGKATYFLTSKIPLKGLDGKANALVGFSLDISKLKQKEEELRDLINVTSLQNKKLINFAHIVSHNLRSHTANFSMLLDFLINEKDEEEKLKIVNMLTDASDNLLETLDNLNEVVAINTNVNLGKIPNHLNSKIEAVQQNLLAFLRNNNAKIINNIPDDIHIKAIPAYLDSILMNFMTNAVKYKDPNRDPIITLSIKRSQDYTVLSIADNGLGIDLKKYGGKLFGMYKTFHSNTDARGIGLYITKNQVEAMNGKIITTSEVGKGTTFNIHFHEKD
ncbi:PAS domain-containing sensor histidine kinase [Sediminicola luteus]|uniref:histidine kinase n=1 Tax=Sediminicola luteus TaxID=319238 RepID=A0ABV2U0V4_9FLAO